MRRLFLSLALLGACGDAQGPQAPPGQAVPPTSVERIDAALPRFQAGQPPTASTDEVAPVRALIAAGKGDQAALQLEALADTDPSGEALFLLGYLHNRAQRHALALPWLARAVEHGPSFPKAKQVFFLYGRSLQETGDLPGARAAYDADSRLYPDQADGLYRLALLDLEDGALDDCEQRAQACLQRFKRPQDLAKTHALLADVYLGRDQLQQAREALERCVQAFPHYEVFYKLSQLCARMGDEAAAARYLQEHKRWRARAGR